MKEAGLGSEPDLFSRLVDRALGRRAAIGPRVPSRFEPQAAPWVAPGRSEASFAEEADLRSPVRGYDTARSRAQVPGTLDRATTTALFVPRDADPRQRVIAPSNSEPADLPAAKSVPASRSIDPRSHSPVVEGALLPRPFPMSSPPNDVALAARFPHRSLPELASELRRAQSNYEGRPLASAAAGEANVVNVTIGRIEVRATQGPAANKPPARESSKPASLDDYLKRRDRGGVR